MDFPSLTAASVTDIAALAARSVIDPPSADEIAKALFAPDQDVVVRGDASAVVATVLAGERAFIRFLAVDPDSRRRGIGRALVTAATADARNRGATSLTVGADAPYYLWPGVDTRAIEMVACCERLKFARVETNFHMDVGLRDLPADPGGWHVAEPDERDAVAEWAERHWPWWRAEMMRALEQGGLVVSSDPQGIAAVCAHDVNRVGLVGPVAVRPDLLGRGRGVAPLLGALHRMRRAGRDRAEISWVGPVLPYARIGATIGRTFFVYRKELS